MSPERADEEGSSELELDFSSLNFRRRRLGPELEKNGIQIRLGKRVICRFQEPNPNFGA